MTQQNGEQHVYTPVRNREYSGNQLESIGCNFFLRFFIHHSSLPLRITVIMGFQMAHRKKEKCTSVLASCPTPEVYWQKDFSAI